MGLTIAIGFTACVPNEDHSASTEQTSASVPDLDPVDSNGIEADVEAAGLPDLAEPTIESGLEIDPEVDSIEPSSEVATIPVEEEGTVELEPGQGVGGF